MNVKFEIGQYVLCDFGDPVSQFKVKTGRIIESQAYPRARHIDTFDRENLSASISLHVIKEHATLFDAYDHLLLHASLLPVLVDSITITIRDENSAERKYYFAKGKLQALDGDHVGVTTRYTYTAVGGMLQSTVPT